MDFAVVSPLPAFTAAVATIAPSAAVTASTVTSVSVTSATRVTSITSAAVIRMITTIVTRMRIALVIRKRIPADVVAEGKAEADKSDERGPPPASLLVEVAARHPGPVIIVKDPAAIVIRRPTPRFVADPRPTVRRTPRPMTITIRRPIAERIDYAGVRPPNPAVLATVGPLTVSIEILGAPNVFVKILNIVTKALCEISLTLAHPLVDRVARSGSE